MATLLSKVNFSGKYGSHYFYAIYYDYSQDKANNQTTFTLYGYIGGDNYASGSGSAQTCYIDGKSIGTFTSITANSNKLIGSTTKTVKHNDDGSFPSTTITGYCNTVWTNLGNATISASITSSNIPSMPRKSSVSCAGGNIESKVSINISRASDTFTHTLRYDFGNLKNQTIVNKTLLTEYPWTLPTALYAQIPNAKSGTGTIYCDTYSGNSLIGTNQTTFTAKTVESKCKPTVTATITDTNKTLSTGNTIQNLTGDTTNKTFIKNVSNAKVVITATPKNSATIKSYKTVNSGKTYTTATSTFENITSNSFTLSATDSRGYTEYTATNPIMVTMIDYIPLSIGSYSFYRPEPTTGEIKLTYKGNYFNGSFGAQNNNLTVKYRYKETTSSTWNEYKSFTSTISGNTYSLTISLGTDFDYQKSYDFQLVVTDKIDSITKSQTVSRGIPALFMGQDRVEVNGILNVNGDTSISGTLTTNGAVNMNDTLTFYGKSFDAGGSVNLANGDIIRANSIYMSDESTGNEGINFLKQNGDRTVKTDYETLRGYRGKAYYADKALAFEPVVLFNNDAGTAGTVTLSETAANFSYLEIYFSVSKAQYDYTKIPVPNNKKAALTLAWNVLDNNIDIVQVCSKIVTVSGTSITKTNERCGNITNGLVSWVGVTNDVYIHRVIGYR